jgi:hypothetical protein
VTEGKILFSDVPHQDDPRQVGFLKVIEQMLQEERDPEDPLNVIPMRGFTASYPDLGWLQVKIEEYWKAGHAEDVDVLKSVISERLGYAVQRCKDWWIDLSEDDYLTIRFKTKDDHGWYTYEFACQLYDHRPINEPIGEGVKVVKDDG